MSRLIKDRPVSRIRDLRDGAVPLLVFVRKGRWSCLKLPNQASYEKRIILQRAAHRPREPSAVEDPA